MNAILGPLLVGPRAAHKEFGPRTYDMSSIIYYNANQYTILVKEASCRTINFRDIRHIKVSWIPRKIVLKIVYSNCIS